ncbi:MAG: transporter, ATP-binding protein [Rickettsiales bacterium]|jgi:iron complex transport system ATP-binding protein|nr:transporter, ATP-binding protein [Rickettsiales bacterium]
MDIIEINHCNVYLSKKILSDFSLHVGRFEHTAILGPNGSGKSTFIRLLTKELYPSCYEGEKPEIKILGRDDWSMFDLRRAISLISPKFSENLLGAAPLSIFDAVASSFFGTYGFYGDDAVTKKERAMTQSVLEKLQLEGMQDRSINELSTGQLRKVLIARAMVLTPQLVLLDEPTSGLDISAQYEFLQFLKRIIPDTTVLLVTHHLEEIIPEIKKVLLIKDGKIMKFGKKEDVLTEQNLSALFDANIGLSISSEGIYSMRRL